MNTDTLVRTARFSEATHFCSFGITEVAIAVAAEAAAAEAAVAAGVTAFSGGLITGVGASLVGGALTGAALGAGESALTGGDPGEGALGGAITGGALGGLGGAGGIVDSATGFGAVGSDALIGAGAGALSAGATGSNPLTGAAIGGVTGAASGALSTVGGPTTPGAGGDVSGAATAGGGTSAAAGGAPGDINVQLPSGGGGSLPTGSIGDVGSSAPALSSAFDAGGGDISGGFGEGGGGSAGGGIGGQAPAATGGNAATPDSFGSDAVPAQALQGKPVSIGGTQAPTVDVNQSFADAITNAPQGAAPGSTIARGGGGYSADPSVDYTGNAAGGGGAAAGGAKVQPGNSIVNAINDPSLSNIGTALSKNAGLLIPAAGLGYEALTQPSTGMSDSALTAAQQAQAQQLGLQGQQLTDTLNTGQLPPALQTAIQNSTASAKAAVRSQYAQMGLSGSTMENQALSQIDQQAAQQTFQQIQSLVQQGVSETSLSNQIYAKLLQTQVQSDAALQSGINNFIGAVAGGAVKGAASG